MQKRGQRGMSLSPFVVIVLPALLVMIGLVVDGGAQAAGSRRAEWVAAAAARVGADETSTWRLGSAQPEYGQAITAAKAMIAGESGVSGEVKVVAGNIVVHTEVVVPTTMLSLIGINQLKAKGSAEAQLVADR